MACVTAAVRPLSVHILRMHLMYPGCSIVPCVLVSYRYLLHNAIMPWAFVLGYAMRWTHNASHDAGCCNTDMRLRKRLNIISNQWLCVPAGPCTLQASYLS